VTENPAAAAHLRHQLRTPLNHIIGYTEMLLEDAEGARPELVADLRGIHAAAHRLLVLVNEFLESPKGVAGAADPAGLTAPFTAAIDLIIASAERVTKHAGGTALRSDLARICSAAEQLLGVFHHSVGAPAGSGAAWSPAPGAASPDAAGEPPAVAAGAAILVVDDNDGNRDMLARRLARQGYRVELAAGGAEALGILATTAVDLVLLDVMMPEMDGVEVLRRLKSHAEWRDLPVLMISALDEIDSVVRCIELGAEDYLAKPFDPVLLRARIGACLEKKRLRDQEARHLEALAEWNRKLEERVQAEVTKVERLGRLRRFVSPQLADLIVAGGADDPLRTHRREVTVLFLDLRGFTAFTETSEPEELMAVLHEYHGHMGKLILEHGGTLERFTGDGMMVFFNDPVLVDNPAEKAVRMAVAMRERVAELVAAWRKRGFGLDLGIGIAHGFATIGAIGFEGRMDYTAIGTVTNLAARLCGEAKPGQILVSQRVAGAVESMADIEPVGEMALKGFQRPVTAFSILGLKS
jgi:class 3 adenylate cyclase/CheY-like chemotaxis protein